MIDLKWDLSGIYGIKVKPFKVVWLMIAYSVQGLTVLSAWAETNREALKRIKGKQLCEENSVLGTVDGWRDLD